MRSDLAAWTDEDILRALDMCEREGLTALQIARRTGRTRNAVIDLLTRVIRETDAVPCVCVRPENHDGGMPARWWARRSGVPT